MLLLSALLFLIVNAASGCNLVGLWSCMPEDIMTWTTLTTSGAPQAMTSFKYRSVCWKYRIFEECAKTQLSGCASDKKEVRYFHAMQASLGNLCTAEGKTYFEKNKSCFESMASNALPCQQMFMQRYAEAYRPQELCSDVQTLIKCIGGVFGDSSCPEAFAWWRSMLKSYWVRAIKNLNNSDYTCPLDDDHEQGAGARGLRELLIKALELSLGQ